MADQPVALVTGARKGIGRHLAEKLVKDGYRVFGCSREPSDMSLGGYTHVQADVGDDAQVRELLARIGRDAGRLDVAINNAGAASMNHALLVPASAVDRLAHVNFKGTFLVCREAAKLMRKHRFGRIVNLSTVAVALDLEGEAIYVATKAAVEALTRVLCRELAEFGITVNAVGPGPIGTDLLRGIPKANLDRLAARLPLKREATAEDVHNVVRFFISKESAAISGQVIYLGGVS